MITVIAYLITSKVFNNSSWYHGWKTKYLIIYLCVGVLMTVVLELYNTMILGRWSYAGIMPVLPVIKIGLVPILQWLIVPILIVYTINFGERLGQTNENWHSRHYLGSVVLSLIVLLIMSILKILGFMDFY